MTTSIACECYHLQDAHDRIAGCGYCHCEAFRDATTRYTNELRYLGGMALDSAKHDLERTGNVYPFFVLRGPDGRLETVKLPPGYVQIYNQRTARHRVFATIRAMVEAFDVSAVVTAGDAWVGRSTEKGRILSKQEFIRISTAGNGFQQAIDLGLVERSEAIVITVQTPLRIMVLNQTYARKGPEIVFQALLISERDLVTFNGAMKMYGTQEEDEDVPEQDTEAPTGDARRSLEGRSTGPS